MSRHRNLQVGYRPTPQRGFLPRAWRRSACASSSRPELRCAAGMREPDLRGVSVSGRLARLAGRGPPEDAGEESRSIEATALLTETFGLPEKPGTPGESGESPNSDRHGAT